MGFIRKLKRKQRIQALKQTVCCGEKMLKKPCYDTDTEEFYFCDVCGKEKFITKAKSGTE